MLFSTCIDISCGSSINYTERRGAALLDFCSALTMIVVAILAMNSVLNLNSTTSWILFAGGTITLVFLALKNVQSVFPN